MLLIYLARSEGLEPPTIGSEVRSSIQLGYERNSNLIGVSEGI